MGMMNEENSESVDKEKYSCLSLPYFENREGIGL